MNNIIKSKLPNFLIVGAPRCGTTSLYYYLKEHPEIFMSPLKEPRFLIADSLKFPHKGKKDRLIDISTVRNLESYIKLFDNVSNEKAIGEASPAYLYYHKYSIRNIKKYLGSPKIIIILRNPIERAFSNYLLLKREGREDLSFRQALDEEAERAKNNWYYIWRYKEIGFYYKQVAKFMKNFPQVKILLLNDLKKRPMDCVKNVFSFLTVNDSFEPILDNCYNASGMLKKNVKSQLLNNLIIRVNDAHAIFFKNANKNIHQNKGRVRKKKSFFFEGKSVQYMEKLRQKNFEKSEVDPKIKTELINIYKNDILKTQDLIKRDLSHWLK